ncbi:MAG: hypothetical protein AB7V44_31840, partial [Pseudonocardia sp.]
MVNSLLAFGAAILVVMACAPPSPVETGSTAAPTAGPTAGSGAGSDVPPSGGGDGGTGSAPPLPPEPPPVPNASLDDFLAKCEAGVKEWRQGRVDYPPSVDIGLGET